MITREKFDELFKRIELDKLNDKCGFEFADGWNCTFENIANCYDDRLELYELVKKQQEVINKVIEILEPLVEIDMCIINGRILKRPLNILTGGVD